MSKERQQGLVAILAANIIFGLNIPVTKALVTHWLTPMGYTTTRMCFGAVIFWVISAFLKREQVKSSDLIIIMIGGLMGFLGTQFLFSQSLNYTTPVVFSLLMALTPVVVLVLSAIFLNEGIPFRKVIGIVISISGASMIILLSGTQNELGSNNPLGILFAVLTVLCFAGYMVITRKVSVKYQPVTIAKWMFLISAIGALPFSFNEMPEQRLYSSAVTLEGLGLIAFALIFSTTIAFFLMPLALKRLEASTVSIFMNLQPLVASVVAIIVGQDRFSWDKPVAAVMVITGVYLVTTKRKKYPKEKDWETLNAQVD